MHVNVVQVPDLPEENPDVRGGGPAYDDRRYRGDTEEQVRPRDQLHMDTPNTSAAPPVLFVRGGRLHTLHMRSHGQVMHGHGIIAPTMGFGDSWWQAEHCWRGLLLGCALHQGVAGWLPCAVCYRMSLMPSGSGGEVVWVLSSRRRQALLHHQCPPAPALQRPPPLPPPGHHLLQQ